MESTYQPLLDWYTSKPELQVIYHRNTGHKALWNDGLLKHYFSQYEWVAISDSDIALSPDTPTDFIEQMIVVAKDFRIDKVGLAIEYKDITNLYLKRIIEPIENQYWNRKLLHVDHQVYTANVDTTFCIVRPNKPFQYSAVRIADWPIKHLDWYSDWSNLTEEELYYFQHADPFIATTLQHYTNWLLSN